MQGGTETKKIKGNRKKIGSAKSLMEAERGKIEALKNSAVKTTLKGKEKMRRVHEMKSDELEED